MESLQFTSVRPGDPAVDLAVSSWVQGEPSNLSALKGRVILVEVFQVNCPGCFLYGLPEAIEVYAKHRNEPFSVIGLATAFEDFDKNNPENLKKLIDSGEVIGETLKSLSEHAWTDADKLRYRIPFPVAMDNLVKADLSNLSNQIESLIDRDITDFDRLSYGEQNRIRDSIRNYLNGREWVAETFDRYNLSGTPTSILIDKKGTVRHILFGKSGKLDKLVKQLLSE